MKRILLLAVVVGLFAAQVQAAPFTMDAITAGQMRLLSVSTGDVGSVSYIGYQPGNLASRILGPSSNYGDTMVYAVGFRGQLEDEDLSGDAVATIGLRSPSLTGMFDGFVLPIANDNNQGWGYRTFVTVGATTYYSNGGAFLQVVNDTQTALLADIGALTDFAGVTGIGFDIQWVNAGSSSDDFHTSVVPVPGAVLLGFLGLGAAGLKLRRFA